MVSRCFELVFSKRMMGSRLQIAENEICRRDPKKRPFGSCDKNKYGKAINRLNRQKQRPKTAVVLPNCWSNQC